MPSARDSFRKDAAESLTDWRLGCIPPRPDSSFERAIFIAGLAEILKLRLQIVYMPLLQGLQRIEDRVAILTAIREDPYAPPPSPKFMNGRSDVENDQRHYRPEPRRPTEQVSRYLA